MAENRHCYVIQSKATGHYHNEQVKGFGSNLQEATRYQLSDLPAAFRETIPANCVHELTVIRCKRVKTERMVQQPDPERYRYARRDGTLYQPANVYREEWTDAIEIAYEA